MTATIVPTTQTSQYPTDPVEMAEALERLAADLRKLDGVTLPPTSVDVGFQVSAWYAGGDTEVLDRQAERIDAVNVLTSALLPGVEATTGTQFSTGQHRRDCLDVIVYTGIASLRSAQLAAENARLRTQLAKLQATGPEPELVGPREVDNGDQPTAIPAGVAGQPVGQKAGRRFRAHP